MRLITKQTKTEHLTCFVFFNLSLTQKKIQATAETKRKVP